MASKNEKKPLATLNTVTLKNGVPPNSAACDEQPPLPWYEAEPDDDPSVMEAAIDKTVQSILAGDLAPAAKQLIADAYRRALERRQLPCVEGREQAMLIVAAGIRAAESLLDGGGKP